RAGTTRPRGREAPLLHPLGEDAQPGAVPVDALGLLPIAAEEQEQVAAEHVTPEHAPHQLREPVEAFAQIDRLAIRVHGELTRRADHPSLRNSSTSASMSSPSTRSPAGPYTTQRAGGEAADSSACTAMRSNPAVAACGAQRNSVRQSIPSSSPTVRVAAP